MSYDIAFKIKAEGVDAWVDIGATDANITWNVREMIRKSTGLEWKNEGNNGLCVDVMPAIKQGLRELEAFPEKYKRYESPNGWGTVEGCKLFYQRLIADWDIFCCDYPKLVNITTFWIE